MNKTHRLAGPAAASLGFALFLTATAGVWGQSAGTSPGSRGMSGFQGVNLRGVGVQSPLANFGQVGGNFTRDFGNGASGYGINRPPPPPTANMGLGQPNYSNNGPQGVAGSQLNSTLVRNSQMARQMFGDQAATSLLGRRTGSGIGNNFNMNPPAYRRSVRGSTFVPGATPASVALDRGLLLRTNSNLARLATGPRGGSENFGTDAGNDPMTIAPATAESSPSPDDNIPAGLTIEQRQKFRMDKEFRDCIERGDEFARSNDFHRAHSSYMRARTISSDDPAPCFRLFIVCMLTRDISQAYVHLRQGLVRADSVEQLKINLADCASSVQDLRKMQTEIDKELRGATAVAPQHAVLSYLSFVLEDPGAARKEAQAALKLAPNSSEMEKLARFMESRNTVSSGG